MERPTKEIFKATPFQQGGVLLAAGILSMVVVNAASGDAGNEWKVVLSIMLLFAAFSPIFSIFQEKMLRYLLYSIASYLLLTGLLVAMAQGISALSLANANYIVRSILALVIFYFMMLGLAVLYRNVLEWLRNEPDRKMDNRR